MQQRGISSQETALWANDLHARAAAGGLLLQPKPIPVRGPTTCTLNGRSPIDPSQPALPALAADPRDGMAMCGASPGTQDGPAVIAAIRSDGSRQNYAIADHGTGIRDWYPKNR